MEEGGWASFSVCAFMVFICFFVAVVLLSYVLPSPPPPPPHTHTLIPHTPTPVFFLFLFSYSILPSEEVGPHQISRFFGLFLFSLFSIYWFYVCFMYLLSTSRRVALCQCFWRLISSVRLSWSMVIVSCF